MLDMSRRGLIFGSAALAALASRAGAFPSHSGETVLPWLDQPPAGEDPTVLRQLTWEELNGWTTPNEKFFQVNHFNWPEIDAATWTLEIDGLVDNPLTSSTLRAASNRGCCQRKLVC